MDQQTAEALAAVLEALEGAADYPEAQRRLAESMVATLPCDRVSVWGQAPNLAAYLLLAEHRALPAATELPRGLSLAAEDLPSSAQLARGRCTRAVRGHSGEALQEVLQVAELETILFVPLLLRQRNEGLIACGVARGGLAERQVGLCQRIAPHVALALRAWRLESESVRTAERRWRFSTMATEVLAASDLETTGARLCELTRASFATTRSALFLLEEDALVPVAAAGPYGERVTGASLYFPRGAEPAFDEALRTGEVLVINEFRSSPYAATPIPLPFRPQAATVIPLADQSGVLGILTASELDDPHRFNARTADEARLLGTLATVALRRVLLVDQLRRAGRAKDDFLAAVSHELRTPLNVVLGYVQLLGENVFGPLTTEQAETIRRVETGARSQLALVNDLLDLAEIERGGLHCDLGPVRIAELATELHDLLAPLIANRPIDFACELPDDVTANTDRERLKQVLVNLLGNAAKFTGRGRIELSARQWEDRVEITVADTGAGMEPAFLRRATEPFVRGEAPGSGTGLGLAIVARMLRALGGVLDIDSKPGTGTIVRVILPPMPSGEATAAPTLGSRG